MWQPDALFGALFPVHQTSRQAPCHVLQSGPSLSPWHEPSLAAGGLRIYGGMRYDGLIWSELVWDY